MPAAAGSGATIIPSAETARLLDDLSALLDGVDLAARFAQVAAGWHAALPDCRGVTIAVGGGDGSPALVLTDAAADRAPGDAASSASIPLIASGGLTAVLHLAAGSPLAFELLRTDIGSLLVDGPGAGSDQGHGGADG